MDVVINLRPLLQGFHLKRAAGNAANQPETLFNKFIMFRLMNPIEVINQDLKWELNINSAHHERKTEEVLPA